VLLTTGSFVLVYVLGTAAALRLLPRGTWSRRAAVVALASAIALVFLTGLYMLWAVVVAAAALVYEWRARPAPGPPDKPADTTNAATDATAPTGAQPADAQPASAQPVAG
jgi:hypothetical protein